MEIVPGLDLELGSFRGRCKGSGLGSLTREQRLRLPKPNRDR
jgi:hypothetical protein